MNDKSTSNDKEKFESRWPDLGEAVFTLAPFKGEKPPAPQWFKKALADKPTEHFIDVEGAQIQYLHWGDRSKPGLILSHGNGAHAHWWSFIAPYLAQEYSVAAVCFSGMGESSERESYSLEHYAREQIAVCEHSGMFTNEEPPIIVAHSFGGFATMVTGALYGDRLAGVIIVDSPINPDHEGGPPDRSGRPHRVYPTLAEALARFRLAPPQTCENAYIVDYIARHSLKEVDGGWTWKFDPQIWKRFEIGDRAQRLKEISCRLAIMRGERSLIFPPEIGDYMYELLGKNVPVIEIPEAQHHIMLDQPLAFVAALRALLGDWNHSKPNRKGPLGV
ncbi:MAG: pimeloyl-ACP methyl ester carboxylesterase [Oceanicoccus sp.]|jgi:pimeloyl-ACP methyl ester carboxylesterase